VLTAEVEGLTGLIMSEVEMLEEVAVSTAEVEGLVVEVEVVVVLIAEVEALIILELEMLEDILNF
jgi:hypothetical protein